MKMTMTSGNIYIMSRLRRDTWITPCKRSETRGRRICSALSALRRRATNRMIASFIRVVCVPIYCFNVKMMASITLLIRSAVICPITNLSMPHLLQELTNLSPMRFQLEGRSKYYLPSFGEALQSVLPICALKPIANVRCFSTCFVSSKYPLC